MGRENPEVLFPGPKKNRNRATVTELTTLF